MDKQFCVAAAICTEYQRLLEECDTALNIWNQRRADVCHSRLIRKETGDELLRWQVKYARAYSELGKHAKDCPICRLVSRVADHHSQH